MNSIISLGVGLQSTTLYYMSSMGIIPRADMSIFADTGSEKSRTLGYWNFLNQWQKENNGIPLYKANYLNIETDLYLLKEADKGLYIPAFTRGADGKVGMLKRQCSYEYKIEQVNKKYRELLGIGNKRFPITEIYIGISFDERDRMQVPREKWKIHIYPFCGYKVFPDGHNERIPSLIKTRSQLKNWLIENKFPVPQKSSCKFCPFQSDENWNYLKETCPTDFEEACKIDDMIRNKSKMGAKAPIFVHSSLQPLRNIEFNKKQKGFF